MTTLRPFLCTAAILLALQVPARADGTADVAPNADKRALNLVVQGDAQRNESAVASVSVPVGRRAWVQLGAGQSRSRAADDTSYRPTQLSAGAGVASRGWQASLNISRRQDSDALRQTDWTSTVDWRPIDGANVGLDASHRSAQQRGVGQGGMPVEQRTSGNGIGAHGALALTDRFGVYGATMHNHYNVTTTAQAGNGLLQSVPLLSRISAVNRDEAALDRSHQLGASYRVNDRVALSGEVLQDRVHDGGTVRSVQMKAAVAAGAGWTLTPGIGHSRGAQGESTNYGMLAANYAW